MRWLFSCLIFFVLTLLGCKQTIQPKLVLSDALHQHKNLESNFAQIDSLKQLIISGDVITRTGNDFTSQSLKTLNRNDKTFSHCGIASLENDSLFIYHALGGEWNPDQKLKREIFENYVDARYNNVVGIYRFTIDNFANEKIIKTARLLYQSEVKFDMDFDLKTNAKMYCSEFIYKVFLQATDSAVKFNHSFINDFEFIGVDDIINYKTCKKIAVLNYKLL